MLYLKSTRLKQVQCNITKITIIYSMKRQNEAKLLQLSTTIQNNLQKLMSSTFQRTLQENVIIKTEVSYLYIYESLYDLLRHVYRKDHI